MFHKVAERTRGAARADSDLKEAGLGGPREDLFADLRKGRAAQGIGKGPETTRPASCSFAFQSLYSAFLDQNNYVMNSIPYKMLNIFKLYIFV